MSKFDMIVELMVKNGVTTKFSENIFKNLVNDEPIIELDFSEHDKAFEDKIAELKKDYKTASELLGKYQQENEALKKRIVELENFSCQAEQETESLVEQLNQRIAELESNESEKTMRIEFHTDNGEMLTPLEVANLLINLGYERPLKAYEVSLSGKTAVKVKTFTVDDLKEIADYLQVYCRRHKDKNTETISF
jgi:TolA-binding protein